MAPARTVAIICLPLLATYNRRGLIILTTLFVGGVNVTQPKLTGVSNGHHHSTSLALLPVTTSRQRLRGMRYLRRSLPVLGN
jgi:hypothetical protein